MSTNSVIAMKATDGTMKAVYCHWDGYPSKNGMLLKRYYDTAEKVEELLAFGDISALADCVENCVFYHRDRGEDLSKPNQLLGGLYEATLDYPTAQWLYVFDNGEWKCYNKHNIKEEYDMTEIEDGD